MFIVRFSPRCIHGGSLFGGAQSSSLEIKNAFVFPADLIYFAIRVV